MVINSPNTEVTTRQPKNNMATQNPVTDMTKRLVECGVKIISLPGSLVQLLGKYGSILLTHDIAALKSKDIELLCGLVAVS